MKPNASAFQFPVHSKDIASFEPRLAEDPIRLMRMVEKESTRILQKDYNTKLSQAMPLAAARIVEWYRLAPEAYYHIAEDGLLDWVVAHYEACVWATLLRAKHDGVNFPL